MTESNPYDGAQFGWGKMASMGFAAAAACATVAVVAPTPASAAEATSTKVRHGIIAWL